MIWLCPITIALFTSRHVLWTGMVLPRLWFRTRGIRRNTDLTVDWSVPMGDRLANVIQLGSFGTCAIDADPDVS